MNRFSVAINVNVKLSGNIINLDREIINKYTEISL